MPTASEIKSNEPVTDDFMKNGVRFLELTPDDEAQYFLHVDDLGSVSSTALTDPRDFMDANYTFARIRDTGEKVMVDDDGIHHDW